MGTPKTITPTQTGISRILFVPDPSAVYEGRQVKNIRHALSANSYVDEFFRAADAERDDLRRQREKLEHQREKLI